MKVNTSNNVILCASLLLFFTACKSSNKISGESSSKSMMTSKTELSSAISSSLSSNDVKTYYAKKAGASIIFNGSSYSAKTNIYFEKGANTVISAQLPFPPIELGRVAVTDKSAKVKSSMLNVNEEIKLPFDVSRYMHYALIGCVPPFYEIYGDDDFRNFSATINSDDQYLLQRKDNGIQTTILINSDLTLHSYTISYLQYQIKHVNQKFDVVSSHLLPVLISIEALSPGMSVPVKSEFTISNVEVNGTNKLDF